MEAALSFPPGRPAMALGADPMSAFPLPSPGLGQDTPRFISERLSPAAVHLGDNISTSSSQRSYSTSSDYFNPIHQQQQQQQQQQQNNSHEDLPWIGTRQQSATPTYALEASAATSIEDITPTAAVESPPDKQYQQHGQHEQQHVEQMSVSLNHQVSLGGPASLGHESLAHSPSFGRQHLQHHQQVHDTQQHQHSWNPSRSLYSAPADLYGSARNTPSPTTAHSTEVGQHDTNTSTTAHFAQAMSNHSIDGGSGDGSGRPPSSHSQHPYSQQQQQQQQQSHHTHHDLPASSLHSSLLSSGHVASAQPRQSAHEGGSTTVDASSSHHSPDMMGFRSQHSPSFPGMGGMPGVPSSLSSKLGPTMSGLPSQSSFHMYSHQPLHHHQHQHQHSDHPSHAQHSHNHQNHQNHRNHPQHQLPSHHHTLPSPTHHESPLRLVPPPLPSQSSLSSLGSPYSSASGSGAPDNSRGYPSYQHQGVHQPSPHPSGLSGPVISDLNNPNGHLTIVSGMGGMNYGSHSTGGSLGNSALGGSRRPYFHDGLHPHLDPTHLGHHPLSSFLGSGKGGMGMGMGIGMSGPASIHERPFKCDQCPQSFNRNHDLKRHKRIHLAVKPFPCNYCDKSFSRKDALKRHRLVKGCGEKQPIHDSTPNYSGLPPPSSSLFSDTTSDGGGNDLHGLR